MYGGVCWRLLLDLFSNEVEAILVCTITNNISLNVCLVMRFEPNESIYWACLGIRRTKSVVYFHKLSLYQSTLEDDKSKLNWSNRGPCDQSNESLTAVLLQTNSGIQLFCLRPAWWRITRPAVCLLLDEYTCGLYQESHHLQFCHQWLR